ncbi:hypothetical protein [Nocardia sp. NPDC058633]|uniref:hypothetical protein n=1 Tax=Nocardia sp. NPDC058633 TaxID=3346568 RepID=UPI0036476239
MTTMSVRIPDHIAEGLKTAADDLHISVNAAVVQAIEQWQAAQGHRRRVDTALADILGEDAALLERLSDA